MIWCNSIFIILDLRSQFLIKNSKQQFHQQMNFQDPEQLLVKIQKSPSNIGTITQSLLKLLSEGRETVLWEHVYHLLECCKNCNMNQWEDKWKLLLYMNALKCIVVKTFPLQLEKNKISSVIFMIYVIKIKEIPVQSEDIPIGLALSFMIYELIGNQKTTIPQFYCFLWRSLLYLEEKKQNYQFTDHGFLKVQEKIGKNFQLGDILYRFRSNNSAFKFYSILKCLNLFLRVGSFQNNISLMIVQNIKQLIEKISCQMNGKTKQEIDNEKNKLFVNEKKEEQYTKIIETVELTPRIADDGPMAKVKELRKKKRKLEKNIQYDIRKNMVNKLQEDQVINDVKNEKLRRREKKEIFILQKQTEEAKKQHAKTKKVKKIMKQRKKSKK